MLPYYYLTLPAYERGSLGRINREPTFLLAWGGWDKKNCWTCVVAQPEGNLDRGKVLRVFKTWKLNLKWEG